MGCTNKQAKAQSHRWCGNHPFMLAWQRSDFSLSPSPWDIIGHAPFSISEPHMRKEWVPALDGNIKQEHGGAPDSPLSGDLNHPSVICCPSLARHTSHTAPFKNNLPMGLICGWLLAMRPFPCECITTLSGITAVQLNINKHFSVTSQSYFFFFKSGQSGSAYKCFRQRPWSYCMSGLCFQQKKKERKKARIFIGQEGVNLTPQCFHGKRFKVSNGLDKRELFKVNGRGRFLDLSLWRL